MSEAPLPSVPTSPDWTDALFRFCLLLGTTLLVSGIAFFYAFNWDQLTRWVKLGSVLGLFLGASSLAYGLGLSSRGGRAALWVGSFLVGVLFAVYGQIYQTGADAFGLFGLWACLLLPWALLARMGALWLLVLALGNLAFSLWVIRFGLGRDLVFFLRDHQLLHLGLLNLLALGLWEYGAASGKRLWMQDRLWAHCILVLVLSPLALEGAFGFWKPSWQQYPAVALLLGLSFFYLRIRYDFIALCRCLLALLLVSTALGVRLLLQDYTILNSALMALYVLLETTLAIRFLKTHKAPGDLKKARPDSHWIETLIAAGGAWLSTAFCMSCLAIAFPKFRLGAALLAVFGLFASRFLDRKAQVSLFWHQLGLSLNILGLGLLASLPWMDPEWSNPEVKSGLFLIAVACFNLLMMRNKILRFFVPTLLLLGLFLALNPNRRGGVEWELLFVECLAGLLLLFLWEFKATTQRLLLDAPLRYGAAFVWPFLFFLHIPLTADGSAYPLWAIGLVLSLILLGLCVQPAVDFWKRGLRLLPGSLVLLALLSFLMARSMPGLSVGLILLLLGQKAADRELRIGAVIILFAFVFLYYYDLQLSLWDKSLAMLGAGIVLLAFAGVLRKERSLSHAAAL